MSVTSAATVRAARAVAQHRDRAAGAAGHHQVGEPVAVQVADGEPGGGARREETRLAEPASPEARQDRDRAGAEVADRDVRVAVPIEVRDREPERALAVGGDVLRRSEAAATAEEDGDVAP